MTTHLPSLLAPDAAPVRLGDGSVAAGWAEGPVWLPERKALRFSDIPNDRILEWRAADGAVHVYAQGVEFTNGRTLDLDGSVIQCSHGRRRVERDRGGQVTPVVEAWNGARFNSPNDVVVASDGAIWFSDPAYGIEKPGEGHAGEREYGDCWVFRHDPATGATTPAVTDLGMPNGLAFSPDESVLYVSDTSRDLPSGVPNPRGGHAIHAYDVHERRLAKNGRTLIELEPGVPDGFRVDEFGNIWTSALDGVHVFTPAGEEIGSIPMPAKVGNVCFGGDDGRTLFVLASHHAYAIRTRVRDAATVVRAARPLR